LVAKQGMRGLGAARGAAFLAPWLVTGLHALATLAAVTWVPRVPEPLWIVAAGWVRLALRGATS
jgi:hypothetical protein